MGPNRPTYSVTDRDAAAAEALPPQYSVLLESSLSFALFLLCVFFWQFNLILVRTIPIISSIFH